MAIHCYFFKYDLDAKEFKFWAEAHSKEEWTIIRLKRDPKEMYVERSFGTPQNDIDDITRKANYKYQDNNYFRCKDCGKIAYLTPDEEWWFKSRGFNIPKRCHDCRNHRKATKKN